MARATERSVNSLASDRSVGAGRWTWNIAEGTVDRSPDLLALYGLSGSDVDRPSLDRLTDRVLPADRSRVMAAVDRTLSTGRAGHTVYFRIRRRDGSIRHIMSRARLERTRDGRPGILAGIDIDLSEETFAVDELSCAEFQQGARVFPPGQAVGDAPDPYSIAVRERDDLLRILDAMPIMVTLCDRDLQFALVNRTFEDVTGWSRSETSDLKVMEDAYPDPAYRAEIAAFMEGCAGWKEITMRSADGRDVSTLWTNVRLSGQRRLGIGLDLTAEKDLERTLRAAEIRLRLAQDIAKIGTFDWDVQRDVNHWSPEMEHLYGLPESGFARTYAAWTACLHPDDLPEAEAAVARALQTGRLEAEWRVVRPDGDILWTEARALVEKDADGRPLRMIGVNLDVTERKRLEQALRDEARAARMRADEFESLGAAAPIGIALFDTDFRFMWCNAWLASRNGLSADEMRGRAIEDVVDRATRAALRELQPRLRAGEAVEEREIAAADPETGETRVYALACAPLFDAGGEVSRFLGVVREVTERRRAEEYREIALQELAHRVKNIFAVVQAIASRTFADERGEAAKAFHGRLNALSAAHELLLCTGSALAKLDELARDTLAAFADGDRLTMAGPHVAVSGRAAQMLALALHELATNAVKYGALSRPGGGVEIRWRTVEDESGAFCELFWRERGGPEVAPPRGRGFGHLMIERLLARDLNGSVALRFPPAGAECDIRWSL